MMRLAGRIKETWGDYKGKKCYEVLQNRKEPCPFCTNAVLRRDQYYICKHHNDVSLQETPAGSAWNLPAVHIGWKSRRIGSV